MSANYLILLVLTTQFMMVQSIDNETTQKPQWGVLVNEVVDFDSGPMVVVNGETVDGQSGNEELKHSQIPHKFLQLYFTYKTTQQQQQKEKKTRMESKSRPLGFDLFNDSNAQIFQFPQPKQIGIGEEGDKKLSPTTSEKHKDVEKLKEQFDQNSSDLSDSLDQNNIKLLSESEEDKNGLKFPNDLVAVSTKKNGEKKEKEKTPLKLSTIDPSKITIIPNKKPTTPSAQPTTTSTTTTTKHPKFPPQCSDTAVDCPEREHLCESPKYADLMWRMCPFTCNACFKKTDSSTCNDASELCKEKANYCNISYYKAIMNRVCPKTCKLC